MDKAGWRQWARDRREQSGPADDAIVAGLRRLLATDHRPGWVVTYRSLPGEVDVSPLEAEPELGPFALTRTPSGGGDLTVHPSDVRLERHRFGFDQPVASAAAIAIGDVRAVLVPGLAFDRSGTRLGHGLGYYDRFLATLAPSAWRIGVARSAVVVDALPAEPHDVAMTHLVTEHAIATLR